VQRSLSRRGRRALEEACIEFLGTREPSFDEWARSMVHTQLRAALWAVNDLETVLTRLGRMVPGLSDPADPDYSERIRDNSLATELIHFWISEEYDELRRASRI
jgi:hypothetical protein